MSEFLWVEKYRPKTIDDCILPDSTKEVMNKFVEKGEIPNLLLAGPPGIGKTTVAKALCEQLGADYYVINGSDEGRFLDTVRNNAKNFASTVSLRQLLNTKSSSLMKQITQPTTYNSSYGRLLRSLVETVDLSLPVITRTRLSNRFIPVAQWLSSLEGTSNNSQQTSSRGSKRSLRRNGSIQNLAFWRR
tara:strand:+ start:2494 stop:3060 length:567 start_codon:yes stop_codon:yes gene_type:complete